jgi:hypothetical protein
VRANTGGIEIKRKRGDEMKAEYIDRMNDLQAWLKSMPESKPEELKTVIKVLIDKVGKDELKEIAIKCVNQM